MATLYELTEEYMQLMEMADDPYIDEKTFNDTLDGLSGEIEEKADSYATVIIALSDEANGLDKEIKRLQTRKATIVNNISRMKANLKLTMEYTGKTKFRTTLFSFGIQNNPPRVVLDSDVPEEYLIPQPPKTNTAKIMDTLKGGTKLDFAHLEQGQSLRIR